MKRIVIYLTAFIFFGTMELSGQTYVIRGTIENAERGQIYLAAYQDDRFSIVDSILTESGSFHFLFDETSDPGLYRVIFSDRVEGLRSDLRFFEFIFNGENVEVYVASGERGPLPYFDNTLENQVYKLFQDYELSYEAQVMITYGQLPESRAVSRYDSIQLARAQFLDSLTNLYPDLYATRMMNAFRAPLIPGAITHSQRIDTLKSCFFAHSAIDDPLLLKAPVYTYKIIDYLSLYKMDTLSMEEQEEQFCLAVDGIMASVSADSSLRSFVLSFLLEGFELLGMETVQIYIADHYLDDACESDVVELVQSRMEGYKAMAIGSFAPDFVIRDMFGKKHRLSHLDSPYVLLIFWASTCEHCQEMISELYDWYANENTLDLEVLAISIDTSEANFLRYTEELKPTWIHAHETLGWNGKIASDYHIYATPSLFLLDREKHIVARPTSYRQFLRVVKNLEN